MSSGFNLIDAPWLPVRRRSGVVEYVEPWRITDRSDDDPCVAFAWPRPDFNGAAHEFLIGLLSSAAAPENDDEWDDWWHKPPHPDALERCFSTVGHAFVLDGPGPRFLQDTDPLEDANDKQIATLLIDTPGAQALRNNTDLFVKRGAAAPVLSRGAAAMALYTMSAYAPAGGKGFRTSLRGGGPMTTLVVADHPRYGSTLWGRLWPNVESLEQVKQRTTETTLVDAAEHVFPWLGPTRTSDPKASGRETTPSDVHPLQVYWGMPRRIRLHFEKAEGRRCGLTAIEDSVVVATYRTRNYGTNYSEGFEHPLTPYYRQNASAVWLPVHPAPGGISYRLWPGLVVPSKDGLREPARVIRHWDSRAPRDVVSRSVAFGYDMDNMKARAWIESEMPLWRLEQGTLASLDEYIQETTAGAAMVARLTTGAVKSARHEDPKNARGDYGFIAERFYRDTETAFLASLEEAALAITELSDHDDPTVEIRRQWASKMEIAALHLFDEYAPLEGLEDRDMHRHVKARFYLSLALRGRGKSGKALFEGELDIPAPASRRSQENQREAA